MHHSIIREGSIARAAKVLRLTKPTVGAQIHALEDALGEKLFERVGRALALTESGQLAYQYAPDIFALGQELQAAVSGATLAKPQKLRVGVVDNIPRLIAFRLVEPGLYALEPVERDCSSNTSERRSHDGSRTSSISSSPTLRSTRRRG